MLPIRILSRTYSTGTGSAHRRRTSAVTPDAALVVRIYARSCVYSFHTLICRAWSPHGDFRTVGVDAGPTYLELEPRALPSCGTADDSWSVSRRLGFIMER